LLAIFSAATDMLLKTLLAVLMDEEYQADLMVLSLRTLGFLSLQYVLCAASDNLPGLMGAKLVANNFEFELTCKLKTGKQALRSSMRSRPAPILRASGTWSSRRLNQSNARAGLPQSITMS
jgi:hypothetical protein